MYHARFILWPPSLSSPVLESRERRWPRWIKKALHIGIKRLWLTIIGSDNGLSPDRRQAIIWTNAGLLLIGPLGTNFSEILIEILTFSFKKMRLKVSSAKRRPFSLRLNVLMSHRSKESPKQTTAVWIYVVRFCYGPATFRKWATGCPFSKYCRFITKYIMVSSNHCLQ